MTQHDVEWFQDFAKHFHLKPDDSGANEAAFIRKVLRLRKGDSVLDAPCGAGRVAACLAKAGINVTGVDLTSDYIKRARSRFRREGLKGRFLALDMRAIDFADEFDGVFNWQGSFGFFSDHDNLDVVHRYTKALRRGGRLLIDMPNREWILRHFRSSGRNGDIEFTARWNAVTQRVESRFHNTRTDKSWAMSIRFYTPGQFASLFRRAGLEVEALYGDLTGREYHRAARRIYVVGRKP